MARNRRSLLSDQTKTYLAMVQGAGDRVVSPGYYGYLTSRETGSFVKYAIMLAEQTLSEQMAMTMAQPQQLAMQVPAVPLAVVRVPGIDTISARAPAQLYPTVV